MNYKELVREALKLLDMYQWDKQSVDTFIEDSAKTLQVYPDILFSHFVICMIIL